MTKCRGCGIDLGNTKIDICRTCLDRNVSEYLLQSKIREGVRRELRRFGEK